MEEINDTAFANQLGRTNVEGKCYGANALIYLCCFVAEV